MIDIIDNKTIYPVKNKHYFPTGIDAIDGFLNGGGLWLNEGVFLCGRPGIGKTAVAAQIAVNIAKANVPVMYIDLEHNPPTTAFFMNEAKKDENDLDSLNLHFVVPETITSLAESINDESERVVIIDYLQLIDLEGIETWDGVIDRLPGGRAYLFVSQITRRVESTESHTPNPQDVRLPGFTPRPSDTFIMLHRDSYYETVPATDMEVFAYRDNDLRGHGRFLWTPVPFVGPFMQTFKED